MLTPTGHNPYRKFVGERFDYFLVAAVLLVVLVLVVWAFLA
jgi:hypothetical protein